MELGPSKPKITRPKLSRYEYAGIITTVAEYITSLKDLDKFIEEPQVNNIIDPCRLAFELLRNGKIDIQMDRGGYETVLFSQCEKDESIENEIERYLTSLEESRKKNLINRIFERKRSESL